MNLEERLAAHIAKAGQTKPVGRQCEASSRPTKASMYGPDEVYRCQKPYAHKARHEDDYGTQWVTYPRFKVVLWLGPS
jgi:hypothetical protein